MEPEEHKGINGSYLPLMEITCPCLPFTLCMRRFWMITLLHSLRGDWDYSEIGHGPFGDTSMSAQRLDPQGTQQGSFTPVDPRISLHSLEETQWFTVESSANTSMHSHTSISDSHDSGNHGRIASENGAENTSDPREDSSSSGEESADLSAGSASILDGFQESAKGSPLGTDVSKHPEAVDDDEINRPKPSHTQHKWKAWTCNLHQWEITAIDSLDSRWFPRVSQRFTFGN